MSLQTLSNQFNSILTQYQNLYQEYISTLNTNTDTSSNIFVTVDNTSYSGGSIISTTTNTSLDACQTSCTSNTSCTGATFNAATNTCNISSGNGTIVNAANSTAIVQQSLSYSYQLQQLNAQLLAINQQMQSSAENSATQYQTTHAENTQQAQILQQNYQLLNEEKVQIDNMVREYETLSQAYNNGNINVTSNYYSYIVLLLISILLIFLLIKFSLTGQQRGGGINSFKNEAMFLFGIMIVFLGLSKIYKNYDSYIFVAILAISYVIAKIKLNQ